jgi:hypothetical protein
LKEGAAAFLTKSVQEDKFMDTGEKLVGSPGGMQFEPVALGQ